MKEREREREREREFFKRSYVDFVGIASKGSMLFIDFELNLILVRKILKIAYEIIKYIKSHYMNNMLIKV